MSRKRKYFRRKPSPLSAIGKLPQEQRDAMERWLFDENLSYSETLTRCRDELGLGVTMMQLRNYYQNRAQRRNIDRLVAAGRCTKALAKSFARNPSEVYNALLNVAGRIVFNNVTTTKDGEAPDLEPVGDILEMPAVARKDVREEQRFLLEREKWEVNVARLCAEHYAELQVIAENEALNDDERLQAIRTRLFGAKRLLLCEANGDVKAAEDCRTPRPGGLT